MRKDKLVRVDKETWGKCRIALPGLTDQAISKVLFNTSLVKLENKLAKKNFKNKVGKGLFGDRVWKKFKKY